MKAPTADYSSLSQALSAKNNALQSSYAAKDASNWKSSYDIQQQSFNLSKKALSLQEENTKFNGIANLVSSLGTLASKVAGWGEEIYSAHKDKGEQELTMNATQMSSEWQTLLNMNPDFMTEFDDPVTGAKTLGLSEKGQAAYEKLEAKYFPSDTKYGWGLDDTAEQLKQNLRVSAVSYAQSLALSNVQGQADIAYSYNLDYARESDLESGEMETVIGSDGRVIPLGKQSKAVIDSHAEGKGSDWLMNQYIIESEKLISARTTRIQTDLSTGYSDGTYILDADARDASIKQMEAHLETITDPTTRENTRQAFISTITSGTKSYFDNLHNSIIEENNNAFSKMETLYETDLVRKKITEDTWSVGKYYSLFFSTDEDGNVTANPYISTSTYTSIMSTGTSYLDNIKTLGGTSYTDEINAAFKKLNNDYESGRIDGKTYGAEFETIMSKFNDIITDEDGNTTIVNWRVGSRAEEAWAVYKAQFKEAMPVELSSNPIFTGALDSLFQTLFGSDDIVYSKLTGDELARAAQIKQEATDKMMAYLMNNPEGIKDTASFTNQLNSILSSYTKEWLSFVESTTNKVNAWDALTGQQVTKQFKTIMSEFTKNYSAQLEPYVTVAGTIDRSYNVTASGVNDAVSNAIAQLGAKLNAEGAGIEDTRNASIKVRLNDNGKPKKDSDGNLIADYIIWDVTSNGTTRKVVYDISGQTWDIPSTPSSSGGNSGITTQIVEKEEKAAAEQVLEGGNQIETIESWLENRPSPSYMEIRDFLATNCINEQEFEATLNVLYNRYKEGSFLPEESLNSYKSLMDGVVLSVLSVKPEWERREYNTTTRAKEETPVTTESKEETPETVTAHASSSGKEHGGSGKSFGTEDETVSTDEAQPTETEEVKSDTSSSEVSHEAINTVINKYNGKEFKTSDIERYLTIYFDEIDTFAEDMKQAIRNGEISYNDFDEISRYYKDIDAYIDATVTRVKNKKGNK